MDFATSLSTGKTYEAFLVNYAQTKSLKLVCPVCKEKVFKRVRRVPHETHMFVHHKGGSTGCELYYPGVSDGTTFTGDFSVSRGQSFEQFIADINLDLRNLLIDSEVLQENEVDDRLMRIIIALVVNKASALNPEFGLVNSVFSEYVSGPAVGTQARIIAPTINDFYSRDGARFIDALFCHWVLYYIYLNNEKSDIVEAIEIFATQRKRFSELAAVMLFGLTTFYADEDLVLFRESFSKLFYMPPERDFSLTSGGSTEESVAVAIKPSGIFRDHVLAPEMVLLPMGEFKMGSPDKALAHREGPQHLVKIDYPLAVGRFPVTFDEWDHFVRDGGLKYRSNNGDPDCGKHPVVKVSWHDIQAYLGWLNKITGKRYRLLSEAEWEYAARAGSEAQYPFGENFGHVDRYAWFSGNASATTHPVGEKLPNAFGLYDMLGNVWEWTADCWNENYRGAPSDGRPWESGECSQRVVRGGSWFSGLRLLRSSNRNWATARIQLNDYGFRVARTIEI